MTNTPANVYTELAQDAENWDGTYAAAAALRTRLKSIPEPRRKPESPAEHALFLLRGAAVTGKYIPRIKDLFTAPNSAHIAAPFLGNPEISDWPYVDPCSMHDEDVAAWLSIVSKYGFVDERVRRFLRIMFRDRRLKFWLPAADGAALACGRDPELMDWMRAKWQTCFPNGLPASWAGFQAPDGIDIHDVRHIFYAVVAWVALGGDGTSLSPSFNLAILTHTSLPKDATNAALVLLAFVPLLRSAGMDAVVLPQLHTRLREAQEAIQSHPSLEKALRFLADVLSERPGTPECAELSRAIEEILVKPRWMGLPVLRFELGNEERERQFYYAESQRFDACWSWAETARWLHKRGDTNLLKRMPELCPQSELMLRLAACPEEAFREDALIPALVAHLQLAYDDTLFLTTPPLARTLTLVELVLLCQHRGASEICWPKLMARALGAERASKIHVGARSSEATAGFVRDLRIFEQDPTSLVREHDLPEDAVVHLAAMQSGAVTIQVAVQAERILRDAVHGPDCAVKQIKFLWRLLQRNPPIKFFDELLKILRHDEMETGHLHDLILAMREMDITRSSSKTAEIRPTVLMHLFTKVTGHMLSLLNASESTMPTAVSRGMREALAALADDLTEVVDLLEGNGAATCSPAWLNTVGRRMERGSGLWVWLEWRGEPWLDLDQIWHAFAAAATVVYNEKGVPCEQQLVDLALTIASLRDRLEKLAWPESTILLSALKSASAWADAKRGSARDRVEAMRLLEQAYSTGGETTAVALAGNERFLACLNSREITSLARFMLDRLLYAEVFKVGRFARRKGMAVLPILSYFHGVFFGIIAGVFAIPDFGTVWNELALRNGSWTLMMVAFCCAAFAYSILLMEFAPAICGHYGLRVRWRAIIKRVSLLFGCCVALACGLSAVVLFSLRGTSACPAGAFDMLQFFQQTALWTGLTLFFGLFVTVILQGRKLRD